jgi:hypothetical protein
MTDQPSWTSATRDQYEEALGSLPPIEWKAKGFLIGEPYDDGRCTITGNIRVRFKAMATFNGRFFPAIGL